MQADLNLKRKSKVSYCLYVQSAVYSTMNPLPYVLSVPPPACKKSYPLPLSITNATFNESSGRPTTDHDRTKVLNVCKVWLGCLHGLANGGL
jgi:hypothetical protein